jgi:serine/threonine protein kinase
MSRYPIIDYNGTLVIDKTKSSEGHEINNYARLGIHYNIPRVYGQYVDEDGHRHLLIEYIENAVSLGDLMKLSIDLVDLLHLVRDVKSTVRYIHSKGVVHSDLGGLDNIIYEPNTKRVFIIDFDNEKFSTAGMLDDRHKVGLVLFLLWHGEISQDLYDSMNEDDYSEFVTYIKQQKDAYSDDALISTILEEIIDLY